MSQIVELWNKEELPIKDGIYFSNGDSFSLKIISYPSSNLQKGDYFNFLEFYKENMDEVTNIYISKEIKLSNGYYCCVGEGSYGSEGFIAYLDTHKNLVWVIYFEASNPFISVFASDGGNVIVESSAKLKLQIDINNPLNLELMK